MALVRVILFNLSYSAPAAELIASYLATEGTFEGCPDLDQADVETVTDAYETGASTVSWDDPAWDADLGLWTPSDATLTLDLDDPDTTTPDEFWPGRTAAVTALLPISGGALDDVPPLYEPSPEDWAEYHKVFDELDQVEPPPHTPDNVNRYSPDSLRTFRRTAWGA